MIKVVLFVFCFIFISSKSICCENCRGLNVLESEVSSVDDCTNKLICTVDCNCLGRAVYYDVTTTYPHEYHAACTLPKRRRVDSFMKTVRIDAIEKAIKDDLSGANIRQTDYGNVLGKRKTKPQVKLTRARLDIRNFSHKLHRYLNVFAQTISRICERGEINSKTPIDVLMVLWRNYRVDDQDFQQYKDFPEMLNIAKEILTNVINVYSERCPCSKIVPPHEYHAQAGVHHHNCHIACRKKIKNNPQVIRNFRGGEQAPPPPENRFATPINPPSNHGRRPRPQNQGRR